MKSNSSYVKGQPNSEADHNLNHDEADKAYQRARMERRMRMKALESPKFMNIDGIRASIAEIQKEREFKRLKKADNSVPLEPVFESVQSLIGKQKAKEIQTFTGKEVIKLQDCQIQIPNIVEEVDDRFRLLKASKRNHSILLQPGRIATAIQKLQKKQAKLKIDLIIPAPGSGQNGATKKDESQQNDSPVIKTEKKQMSVKQISIINRIMQSEKLYEKTKTASICEVKLKKLMQKHQNIIEDFEAQAELRLRTADNKSGPNNSSINTSQRPIGLSSGSGGAAGGSVTQSIPQYQGNQSITRLPQFNEIDVIITASKREKENGTKSNDNTRQASNQAAIREVSIDVSLERSDITSLESNRSLLSDDQYDAGCDEMNNNHLHEIDNPNSILLLLHPNRNQRNSNLVAGSKKKRHQSQSPDNGEPVKHAQLQVQEQRNLRLVSVKKKLGLIDQLPINNESLNAMVKESKEIAEQFGVLTSSRTKKKNNSSGGRNLRSHQLASQSATQPQQGSQMPSQLSKHSSQHKSDQQFDQLKGAYNDRGYLGLSEQQNAHETSSIHSLQYGGRTALIRNSANRSNHNGSGIQQFTDTTSTPSPYLLSKVKPLQNLENLNAIKNLNLNGVSNSWRSTEVSESPGGVYTRRLHTNSLGSYGDRIIGDGLSSRMNSTERQQLTSRQSNPMLEFYREKVRVKKEFGEKVKNSDIEVLQCKNSMHTFFNELISFQDINTVDSNQVKTSMRIGFKKIDKDFQRWNKMFLDNHQNFEIAMARDIMSAQAAAELQAQ